MTDAATSPTHRVGIVVVSHSRPLAQAAVDLALQMAPQPPPIAIAAGTADGEIGTDAIAVAAAIDSVAAQVTEGVLVLMDLGSAVLSAEMALELSDHGDVSVVLSPAPLVEGLVGAIVQAAAGQGIAQVADEAGRGLAPKQDQLGGVVAPEPDPDPDPATAGDTPSYEARATLVNHAGLHLRPASAIVALAASCDAVITVGVANGDGRTANADSVLGLVALKAVEGTEVTVSATGPERVRAVDAVVKMARDGFGEQGSAAN